jgi:acetoin utilization protein AcuB
MIKQKKMPVVGAVMTSFPYFVEVDDTATKMERIMDEHGIRHLPVQEKGKVIGIVSERDLHHYVKREAAQAEKNTIQARHIMIPHPYVVPFRAPLNEVVFEMARRRIGSVIVQRQGKLAGILSAIDVCRILGEYLESMFPGGRRGGSTAA